MKFAFIVLLPILTLSCARNPPVDNGKNANIKAKNEQLAISNEASAITRAAQRLENQGRGLEIFRASSKPEAARECNSMVESSQKEREELAARIERLPEKYKLTLTAIIPELNECCSCSKQAMPACVKARASINAAIKELFPK